MCIQWEKTVKNNTSEKSEKNELDLLCRQKYYITSTTPWYNPISITVVLSGVIAAKRSLKDNKKLQNRAARILTSSSYDADARYLLQHLGWKDLITQRQIQVLVFKALKDLAPDYLFSMFTERSTSGYVLRDSTNKLNVPLPRTNYLKRSFSHRGATLWNSLPCNLRQEKSLNRFKQLLNFHFS